MTFKMMDFSEAFPKRVNVDQYKQLIDAASNAALGADNLSRVAAETFATHQLAVRAANAIRNYARSEQLLLKVSCPENSKTIYVYKSAMLRRPRRSKKDAASSVTAKQPEGEGQGTQGSTAH